MNPNVRLLCTLLSSLPGTAALAAESGLYSDYRPEGPRWRVAVSGGYAGTGLGAVTGRYREAFREMADAWASGLGGSATASARGGTSGIAATGDFGFAMSTSRGAGIRVAWLKPVAITAAFSGTHPLLQESVTERLDLGLTSILVGGWAEHAGASGIDLKASLYAGVGLATLAERMESAATSPFFGGSQSDSASSSWEGTATVTVHAGLEVGYRVTPAWRVFLGGGYVLARVRSMTATRDSQDSDGQPYVRKGDVFADGDGRAIPFDFSGLHGIAGLRVSL